MVHGDKPREKRNKKSILPECARRLLDKEFLKEKEFPEEKRVCQDLGAGGHEAGHENDDKKS